jgi:hypothetical protein
MSGAEQLDVARGRFGPLNDLDPGAQGAALSSRRDHQPPAKAEVFPALQV